ncbi:hypothetical protein RJT34_01195 [Clitoria ternatea]|uniref:Uncharacterized protein n=1 Tax=Clitoria ternatea TaxID=43366 RepID=A0AAN9KG12_CLITE
MGKQIGCGHYHADPVCLLRSGSSHVMSTNVNKHTNFLSLFPYAFTPHHPNPKNSSNLQHQIRPTTTILPTITITPPSLSLSLSLAAAT